VKALPAQLVAAILAASTLRAEIVTTLDGRQVEGTLTSITSTHVVVRTAAGEQKLAIGDVLAVAFEKRQTTELMATAGQHVVMAADGSRLAVRGETIADGKLTASTAVADKLSLPLGSLVRLVRPRAHEKPAEIDRQREAQKLAAGQKDAMLVAGGPGEWVAMPGILIALDGDKLLMNYEGTETPLDASGVALIEFARPAGQRDPPKPAGLLVCTDGSQIAFSGLEIRGKELRVAGCLLPNLAVDAARAAVIRFEGAKVAHLSDLKPSAVRQTPFFDEEFVWRKDQSVAGTPLRLGGTTYEKGLGLHARCEISFDLSGQYKALVAKAGIDDTAPAGSAVLRAVGDGKALLPDALLEGGKPAQGVRIDLTGVKTLTIVADFAPDTFGAGSRLNLCDAVLTR
jgi:hypothetical protein